METSELLSPAGDFDTALAAFNAGADAVYCGLTDFSARAFAKNFSFDDLRRLVRYAHSSAGRKVYVTFNTLLDESSLEDAVDRLSRLEACGVDAVIVQDLGVARIVRRHFHALALHASTQLVAHNLEGVLALKELGFTRVVLARELSLAEIESIARRCGGMELEVFIHGALCYSVSGLCLYSAMEKDRSGNRGKCAYCCRLPHRDAAGETTLPFSMKDLRLGEDVRRLAALGVSSLKIEGRMKSPLYVAAVTKWYRDILDGRRPSVTTEDLETVFSRKTTLLYLNGVNSDVIDAKSPLGHLGAPIGTVKRITRDREGVSWLRFHTTRALERHDGLQFVIPRRPAPNEKAAQWTFAGTALEKVGFGISDMRLAISRNNVFEVPAGSDVEVRLDSEELPIRPGDTVYCSMSNRVKRDFPAPAYRESDYPGNESVDIAVELAPDRLSAAANGVTAVVNGRFESAKDPSKTYAAVEKAFSKLGGTDYSLGKLTLVDTDRLYAPMSMLNDLRRDLVERLDERRERDRIAKVDDAVDAMTELPPSVVAAEAPRRVIKLRAGQTLPDGDWDEVVVAINSGTTDLSGLSGRPAVRLATPVYTSELAFNRLRNTVKRLLREGYRKWECSDLATLRMLRQLGVDDLTADWSLYAFNSAALAALSELGVKRFTASPESTAENLAYLAESGYAVDFLKQQSTPLFISLTEPASRPADLEVFVRDGLWITTKPVPRTFRVPEGATERIDLSWDADHA